MPRPLRATIQEMADAVARQVRRDGFFSPLKTAAALPVSDRTVRDYLPRLLPLLPGACRQLLAVRHFTARRVPDEVLAERLTRAVRAGVRPRWADLARAVGVGGSTFLRRVPYLICLLPPDVALVVRGRLRRPALPPRRRFTRRRGPVEVMAAVYSLLDAGREVTASSLALELGISGRPAARWLYRLRDRLPPGVAVPPPPRGKPPPPPAAWPADERKPPYRKRNDAQVVAAALAVAREEGRLTAAGVARRLGVCDETARKRLREVARKLPRRLRAAAE